MLFSISTLFAVLVTALVNTIMYFDFFLSFFFFFYFWVDTTQARAGESESLGTFSKLQNQRQTKKLHKRLGISR